MAGVVAGITALGLHVSWGTPGVAMPSEAGVLRGSVDAGFGISSPLISWSADAGARLQALRNAEGCPERSFSDAAGALPTPCREDVSAPGQSLIATLSRHTLALESALGALAGGNLQAARDTAAKSDAVNRHLVAWAAATAAPVAVSASEIAETIAALGDWPNQDQMRARYELALAREHPGSAIVLAAFADVAPTTTAGTVLLAQALGDSGRRGVAEALIRRYWRQAPIAADAEPAILSAFGDVLTPADHWARVAGLVYRGKTADADRASRLLDPGRRDLVKAWIAAARQRPDADQLLAKVAPEQQQDPACLFARVMVLHQAGKITEAASLMLTATTDSAGLIDPDAWSEERRSLARLIAEQDPRTAFALTSANLGASAEERVEGEIDAGWYALRYLADPVQAERHFRWATSIATTPTNKARAEYWLGRTADALGRSLDAATHYSEAGRIPTAYYGQLALAKLGSSHLPIAPAPLIDQGVERRFLAREQVQAAGRLAAIGRLKDARIFYRHLAETLTDPAEIALLAEMAKDGDNYPLALQLGKVANARQAGADAVAFPVAVIPALDRADVELPAIYAVARQESEFQVRAVSPVGAQGLLQLMPATAKEVADRLGLAYSKDRLGTDPCYNATLGAAFLGSLLAQFDGSYAMSFAAYNAGAGRVQQWALAYGDPRRSDADVVDWIERIPFDETRNYVKHTLENLQVYRARFGMPALRLTADLTGQPGNWRDPLASVPPRRQLVAELPAAIQLARPAGEDRRDGDGAAVLTRVSMSSAKAAKPAVLAEATPPAKPKATPPAKAKATATVGKAKGKPAAKTTKPARTQGTTGAKGQHRHKAH